MDLYEALKSGTSAADLVKAFNKDLEEANARIAAEKEAEAAAAADKEYLDECRTLLAEAILDYAEAYFGNTIDEENYGINEVKSIEKVLLEFEKEMGETMSFFDQIKDLFKKLDTDGLLDLKFTTEEPTDDEIINKFLKTYKIDNNNKTWN